jgi:3-isopropylmalate/(R)-2-methylmalate dehydratase small subunit
MQTVFQAPAHVFPKNIDTDQIYPARYLDVVDPAEIARHCLEGVDPSFAGRFTRGGIVVAATNFGCGSSREHAAIALVHAGVSVVVAESFARIFYRNAINLALPLLVCPGVAGAVKEGDTIRVDIEAGTVQNTATGATLQGEKLSAHAMRILSEGGLKAMFRERKG